MSKRMRVYSVDTAKNGGTFVLMSLPPGAKTPADLAFEVTGWKMSALPIMNGESKLTTSVKQRDGDIVVNWRGTVELDWDKENAAIPVLGFEVTVVVGGKRIKVSKGTRSFMWSHAGTEVMAAKAKW